MVREFQKLFIRLPCCLYCR